MSFTRLGTCAYIIHLFQLFIKVYYLQYLALPQVNIIKDIASEAALDYSLIILRVLPYPYIYHIRLFHSLMELKNYLQRVYALPISRQIVTAFHSMKLLSRAKVMVILCLCQILYKIFIMMCAFINY